MTISERIFELIRERGYTQKEFSKKTGIAESTISDWKKKGTNPVSDKILIICEVLEVTPYYLLSGIENNDKRSSKAKAPAAKPAAVKAPEVKDEGSKDKPDKPEDKKPEVKAPDIATVARDDDDVKIGHPDDERNADKADKDK